MEQKIGTQEFKTQTAPRKPDFKGNIKIAAWVNGDTISLHIGDMKLRLTKNDDTTEAK